MKELTKLGHDAINVVEKFMHWAWGLFMGELAQLVGRQWNEMRLAVALIVVIVLVVFVWWIIAQLRYLLFWGGTVVASLVASVFAVGAVLWLINTSIKIAGV